MYIIREIRTSDPIDQHDGPSMVVPSITDLIVDESVGFSQDPASHESYRVGIFAASDCSRPALDGSR